MAYRFHACLLRSLHLSFHLSVTVIQTEDFDLALEKKASVLGKKSLSYFGMDFMNELSRFLLFHVVQERAVDKNRIFAKKSIQ